MSRQNANKIVVSRKRHRDNVPETAEDDHVPPKSKRQYTEQDQKFAELYEKLADQSQKLRLEGAKQLLQELSSENKPSAEVLEKVITRLFRGLSSGRKAARYGYFVALTELLRQVYGPMNGYEAEGFMSLDELVELMVQLTKADKQAVGQEKRDHQFGRMYGSKAFIQSAVLSQGADALGTLKRILDLVFEIATSVPWLREECGMVIVDAIKSATEAKRSNEYIKACIERLDSNRMLKTPEGVAVWLTTESKFPAFSSYPAGCWANNDPLDADNRADLRRAMRDQYTGKREDDDTGKVVKSGVWQQTVHFAWDILLDRAIQLSKPDQKPQSKEDEPNKFRSIWKGLVDNGLFLEGSSIERKFWGFQLLSKWARSSPDWAVSSLFQPNLVQNLISSQSNESQLLHEAAVDALKKIKTRVVTQPELAHAMIAGLISKNGTAFFDRVTKTKTTEEIMIAASPKAFSKIIEMFDDYINNQTGKDEKDAEKGRQALGDLLLHAFQGRVKAGLTSTESDIWIKKLLTLLVTNAYCKPRNGSLDSKASQPAISEVSRKMFQARLSSCLAFILPVSLANPCHWPWYTLHHLHSITKSSKPFELALEADKEVFKTLKKSYGVARGMHGKLSTESVDSATEQIVLLFSMSLLEAYNGDTDAVSILGELNESFGSDEESQQDAKYDQVLEILLSFMSKSSALYRTMATSIFTATTSRITSEGLESLAAIIRQPETLSGQQELFAQAGADEESSSDDNGSDEMDSDVELVDAPDAESSGDSDDDAEDSGEESELDNEVEEFEKKLALALKTSQPGALENNEMTDDESMDDEEMLAIEPKLAAVFRERQIKASKQKEKKNAKENVVIFKKRVLDLLNIYVKQEYTNSLILELLLPLLELIRISPDPSLQGKAKEILDTFSSICTKNKAFPVPEDGSFAWTLLEAIHAEAGIKVHDKKQKLHSAACSKSSLFVVRVLVAKDTDNYGKAVDVYAGTQKKWFADKKGAVQATFFTEWISWSVNSRK